MIVKTNIIYLNSNSIEMTAEDALENIFNNILLENFDELKNKDLLTSLKQYQFTHKLDGIANYLRTCGRFRGVKITPNNDKGTITITRKEVR